MFLICLVCFLFQFTSSNGQGCQSGYDISRANNDKCYKVVFGIPNQKSWFDAEKECLRDGGHLVSIPSAIDKANINALVAQKIGTSQPGKFWLGANNFASWDQYVWTDETPFVYSNWQNGQPNVTGSNCVMSSLGQGSDKWGVLQCIYKNNYVCETIPKNTTCHDGWHYYENTTACYKVYQNPTTWDEAQALCSTIETGRNNGSLASILSEEENVFITGMIEAVSSGTSFPSNCDGTTGWYWIGFTETYDNVTTDVTYAWSDAELWGYSNTVVDSVSEAHPGPDCGQISAGACHISANDQIVPGQWYGFACPTALPFICKTNLNA